MVILQMFLTVASVILAGILNSLWCKTKINFLNRPIDNGKKFLDNKRIFGDHKTWKGFFGYVFFNIVTAVFCGFLYNFFNLNQYDFIYQSFLNAISFNLILGALFGLAYALFELPNSFLKRRLNIRSGKSIKGWKKVFFIFLDQADSVFGVCLVVALFHPMSIGFYLTYVLLGAVVHILINMLLYLVGLRKNRF